MLSPCTDLLNTYIFLLQVQDMIDSFFHVLRESCHSHTVGVRSSTLGKANIHLQHKNRTGLTSEHVKSHRFPTTLVTRFTEKPFSATTASLFRTSIVQMLWVCTGIPGPEAWQNRACSNDPSSASAVLTAERPTAFCAALAAEAEEGCISRQCPHTAASIFTIKPLA